MNYHGVTPPKRGGTFRIAVTVGSRVFKAGPFKSAEGAARWYDLAVTMLAPYGADQQRNFPDEPIELIPDTRLRSFVESCRLRRLIPNPRKAR